MSNYPKSLIRKYEGKDIEWHHVGDGHYKAFNYLPTTIADIEWLISLPEVLGKWKGTLITFEIIQGNKKIEIPYYVNYVFGQKAINQAWEVIVQSYSEITIKSVETMNPRITQQDIEIGRLREKFKELSEQSPSTQDSPATAKEQKSIEKLIKLIEDEERE